MSLPQIKRYHYSYQTLVRYEGMVSHHHFQLRCTPLECSYMQVVESGLQLLNSANISTGKDNFGATIHYGSIMQRHDLFVVLSSGEVRCAKYRVEESEPKYIYKESSPLTRASEQMAQWADGVKSQGSPLEQTLELSMALHSYMSYSSGVTSTQTTAAESFSQREGVCQDFSHILIALSRLRGISARYVAGLVVGTGESHAWVEVYDNGAWWGVDPTHNTLVEWGYIALAHGRDASDCSLNRGMHRGAYPYTTQVRVVVEEIF